MRFPFLIACCSAGLAVAGPLDLHLNKRFQDQVLFERVESGGPATFAGRGRDFAIRLTAGDVKFLSDGAGAPLDMRLIGAKPSAAEGCGDPGANVNYLLGPRSQWRTGKVFSSVCYRAAYPGVDLTYYGRDGQLEVDFRVGPGADPSAIQIEWHGAKKVELSRSGELTVSTPHGRIRWAAPILYQQTGEERRRIDGGFRLLGRNRVGFVTSAYDHGRELVIDPVAVFSTFLGGSAANLVRGTAVDSSGNVYVTGHSSSLDLPVTKGAYQTGYGGGTSDVLTGDVMIAKYSPSGTLLFLTYLGGQKDDCGWGIAVDASGSVYVTGYTNSTDFPVTQGVIQTKFGGFTGSSYIFTLGDAFVSKLSGDGTKLIYSTYLGGLGDDGAFAIAVDASGDAYITGTTNSNAFPTSPTAFQKSLHGSGGQEYYPAFGFPLVGGDAFVSKLNPTATALLYSTFVGGTGDDVATTIALDGLGNAYIGGYTLSYDYPTTTGALKSSFSGAEGQNEFFIEGDGFITKLNPSGSALVYSTYVGGSGDDCIAGLTVDGSGDVFATGNTTSPDFQTTSGSFQPKYAGPTVLPFFVDQLFGDAFLLKLNPAGNQLVFSTYFGGSGDDYGMGLALDSLGNVILTGFTDSPDFPVTSNALHAQLAGPQPSMDDVILGDAFVAQFSPTGSRIYATYVGGTLDDAGLSAAVSSSGAAYVGGSTYSPDFPVVNAAQATFTGKTGLFTGNAFVLGISGFGPQNPGVPSIDSVLNASGETPSIAPNTWIEIKGGNLSAATPRIWQSSDFVGGQLPTQLNNLSATINGEHAFVYYISGTQVNVLTPADAATGTAHVVVTSPQGSSSIFNVQMQAYAPGFFQFGGTPYVAATHADGSYIAPAALYPGLSTPAKPNETVVIYGNGFGAVTPAVVNGSVAQSGTMPVNPVISIGGVQAQVVFAGLVAPGEFQFNVVIPPNLPSGDAAISATIDGFTTQAGALLTIQ